MPLWIGMWFTMHVRGLDCLKIISVIRQNPLGKAMLQMSPAPDYKTIQHYAKILGKIICLPISGGMIQHIFLPHALT